MGKRIELAIFWAHEQGDFIKVDPSFVLLRCCEAVALLTDEEVEIFHAESCVTV